MTDVEIPAEIVDEGAEGAISVWLFRDGETVVAGDVLAEVMNEKAAAELVAPASGRLNHPRAGRESGPQGAGRRTHRLRA